MRMRLEILTLALGRPRLILIFTRVFVQQRSFRQLPSRMGS